MDKNIEYETPHSYLTRLIKHDSSNKFRIIITLSENKINGNTPEEKKIIFDTTINKARVISRKIDDAYQVDPTITEYYFKIPKEVTKQVKLGEIEEALKKLIKSTISTIQIKKSEQDSYSIITSILNGRNDSQNELKYEIRNNEEAISLLSTELESDSIEYLSGHIIEFMTKTELKNIEEGIIYNIINSFIMQHNKEQKKKKDDDEIKKIFEILKSKQEDQILMHFLLSLEIDEYDKDMIEYIYENLDDDVIERESSQIIFILKAHFLKVLETSKKNEDIIECEYNGNELSGIINYLQKQNGTNLEANNILKLSGGGYPNSYYPITNLIKYNSNNTNNEYYYNYNSHTPSSNDGWIEFDFGNKTVNLTSYTLRAWDGGYSSKSWRIVGSNDHNTWEVIDHRVNNSEINGGYKQHRFDTTKSSNYYRYIQYVQEEVFSGSQNNSCIVLTRIEFFGSISSPK